jgi:hypothetical protein
MQQVRDHRQARQQCIPKERVQAHEYWEGRKAELGITRDMPMGAKLERIGEARAHTVRQAPERPSLDELRAQERDLTHSITGLERHVEDLQHYGRREHQIDRRQVERAWREELAAERVLAAGKAHGLPQDHHAEQMVARLERTERLHAAAQQLQGLTRWGTTSRSKALPCGSSSSIGRRNANVTRG